MLLRNAFGSRLLVAFSFPQRCWNTCNLARTPQVHGNCRHSNIPLPDREMRCVAAESAEESNENTTDFENETESTNQETAQESGSENEAVKSEHAQSEAAQSEGARDDDCGCAKSEAHESDDGKPQNGESEETDETLEDETVIDEEEEEENSEDEVRDLTLLSEEIEDEGEVDVETEDEDMNLSETDTGAKSDSVTPSEEVENPETAGEQTEDITAESGKDTADEGDAVALETPETDLEDLDLPEFEPTKLEQAQSESSQSRLFIDLDPVEGDLDSSELGDDVTSGDAGGEDTASARAAANRDQVPHSSFCCQDNRSSRSYVSQSPHQPPCLVPVSHWSNSLQAWSNQIVSSFSAAL